jgi:hypothetical protein
MPARPTKVVYSYSALARPLDIAYVDEAHKKFKKFCDNLRCPLCGSQLDGNVHHKEAKLYCVNNNDEYKCRWVPGSDDPEMECLKFWYYPFEYVIGVQKNSPNVFYTVVDRYNTDVIPFYRNSTRKELLNYQGPRIQIFRQRMEEQQFLKKLKTYNVFS